MSSKLVCIRCAIVLVIGVAAGVNGCKKKAAEMPHPPPMEGGLVLLWDVDSAYRGVQRFSIDRFRKSVFESNSDVDPTFHVERKLTEEEYAQLAQTLKQLACCDLRSSREKLYEEEAKPRLSLRLPGLVCDLALWDGEWLEGTAQECGMVVASVHGRGYVPDAPE